MMKARRYVLIAVVLLAAALPASGALQACSGRKPIVSRCEAITETVEKAKSRFKKAIAAPTSWEEALAE